MDITAICVTAFVSSVVGAVVGAVVSGIKKAGQTHNEKTEMEKAEEEAMRLGIRALLWREIKTIHSEAVTNGGLDIEARRHLEGVYVAYHGLGGNGTGTRLFNEAMNLQIID